MAAALLVRGELFCDRMPKTERGKNFRCRPDHTRGLGRPSSWECHREAAATTLRDMFFEPGVDRFRTFCHRTVPKACELIHSTEIGTDVGSILRPQTPVRHSQNASGARNCPSGTSKQARSSGLQRICCILSKTHGSGPVAQNGLGGWGGAGGLQSCPISVTEYSASSGRGPAAVGPEQNMTFTALKCF